MGVGVDTGRDRSKDRMHYWGMVGNGGWVQGVGGGGMGAVGVCILGCSGEGMVGWGYYIYIYFYIIPNLTTLIIC